MFAIVAPAIQGQFDSATLPQIKKSIELLGFEKVYEVALGADAVAWEEQAELAEKMEAGVPMTTSCCPAFVNLAKMHFPQIYENNMSTVVSPMMALARKLKKDHPGSRRDLYRSMPGEKAGSDGILHGCRLCPDV